MQEKVQRGNTGLAIRAGFWYVVSTFLMKGISFITTPIFSRVMDSASYGEFSNYASWQTTLLIITGAELHNTLAPAYYDHPEDYDHYVSSVTVASCILTGLFYLLFLSCRRWIYNIVAIPEQYVQILFLTLAAQACKSVFLARERTLYHYKSVAALSMINLVVPTLIALMLVLFAPAEKQLSARIYGQYVPLMITGFLCGVYLLKKGLSFRFSDCDYAFRLALPLVLQYLMGYLLTSTNTIITKSILGASAAAVVSIAVSAIHMLTIFFQAVSGAVITWLMDNIDQKKSKKLRHDTLLYIGLLTVATGGIMLLAPEVIWVLGGTKYADAGILIPGLAAGAFFQAVSTLFATILTYEKKLTKMAVCTGIVALLSLAAKISLTQQFGYTVQPYVNLLAYILLFLINYLLVCKTGHNDCLNFRGICTLALFVLLFMGVCPFLYRHTVLRWGVIVVMGLAAVAAGWKHRKKLMAMVHRRKQKSTIN